MKIWVIIIIILLITLSYKPSKDRKVTRSTDDVFKEFFKPNNIKKQIQKVIDRYPFMSIEIQRQMYFKTLDSIKKYDQYALSSHDSSNAISSGSRLKHILDGMDVRESDGIKLCREMVGAYIDGKLDFVEYDRIMRS